MNYISSLDNLRVALKRHVLNQPHLTAPYVLQVTVVGLGSGPDYAQVLTGIKAEVLTINPNEFASIATGSMGFTGVLEGVGDLIGLAPSSNDFTGVSIYIIKI